MAKRIKDQMGQAENLVYNTEVPCWDGLGLGELGCERAGEGG